MNLPLLIRVPYGILMMNILSRTACNYTASYRFALCIYRFYILHRICVQGNVCVKVFRILTHGRLRFEVIAFEWRDQKLIALSIMVSNACFSTKRFTRQ